MAWFQPRPRIDDVPDDAALGFSPQASVRWLGPRGLAITGFQVFLSGIFSWYADKREMQAALKSPQILDRSDDPGLWFDWLADTGDGFDASYGTAALLAAEGLDLAQDDPASPVHRTERGSLLVLGGDLTYPAASPQGYRDRMIGPYRAALPAVPEGREQPTMLIVAGNHDWYDGLTSFLRWFCRGRDIGGWRTEQSRSYFTVKLAHRWWLIGLDLAFDQFIDVPQLDYFKDVVTNHMQPGDKVIVTMHQPGWLFGGLGERELYTDLARSNLEEFEREVIHPSGVHVALTLAGDIHHYNRYEREDGSQTRITSGSGAAFLYPTHNIPQAIRWPEADGVARYERRAVYPSRSTSKRLRWRTLLAPFLNPSYILFVGVLYLLFALQLSDSVSGRYEGVADAMDRLDLAGLQHEAFNSAGMVLVLVIVFLGLVVFADCRTRWGKVLAGFWHTLFQLDALVLVAWGAARWVPNPDFTVLELRSDVYDLKLSAFAVTYGLTVIVVGGLVGSMIYACYLFTMQTIFKKHPTHAFSAQRWEHHRNFLRMRLEDDGGLTIYSIGVRRVPRRWRYVDETDRAPHERWFEPVDRPLEPFLVEAPIRLGPDGRTRSPG